MATLGQSRTDAGTIVPHELTLNLYRKMLTTFYVDERLKVFSRQGKCTFHASARDCLYGTSSFAMLSRGGDPNSNGRNMPEQFSSRELNLVVQTACTGT